MFTFLHFNENAKEPPVNNSKSDDGLINLTSYINEQVHHKPHLGCWMGPKIKNLSEIWDMYLARNESLANTSNLVLDLYARVCICKYMSKYIYMDCCRKPQLIALDNSYIHKKLCRLPFRISCSKSIRISRLNQIYWRRMQKYISISTNSLVLLINLFVCLCLYVFTNIHIQSCLN